MNDHVASHVPVSVTTPQCATLASLGHAPCHDWIIVMLPALATLIGAVVLGQLPTTAEIAGSALIAFGVALHQERRALESARKSTNGL